MLTQEQERVLEKACAIFLDAMQEEENNANAWILYNNAFEMLAKHIDDVDDVYYNLVFANCIERMQKNGNMRPVYIHVKEMIYIEVLKWFLDASQYKDAYAGHLMLAFSALGEIFISGEEKIVPNDEYAYICFQCIKLLDMQEGDEKYMRDFVQDKKTGQWKFIGKKPQYGQ